MNSDLVSRNRSAELFLLTKNSEKCGIFELELDKSVDVDVLRSAVDEAVKRLPLIASEMVRSGEEFYYTKNNRPVVIVREDGLPVLGTEQTNHHAVCLIVREKTIIIPFHHSLTDGVGMERFIGTLMYYYHTALTGSQIDPESVRINDCMDHPDVWEDPFDHFYEVSDGSGNSGPMHPVTDGLVLPENEGEPEYRRFFMEIDTDDFMRFSKSEGTSPMIASTLLMMHAIRKEIPDSDKPIAIRFPVDIRHHLGTEETLRNAVLMKPMRYTPATMDSLSFREQARILRGQLDDGTAEQEIKGSVNGFIALMNQMDEQGTMEKKRAFLRNARKPDTTAFLLSYVRCMWPEEVQRGICEFGAVDLEPYLKINIWAMKKSFFVDIIQPFTTSRYVEAFAGQLKSRGITVSWKEKELKLPDYDLDGLMDNIT